MPPLMSGQGPNHAKQSQGGTGTRQGSGLPVMEQSKPRGTGRKTPRCEQRRSAIVRPWARSVHDGDGLPGKKTKGEMAPGGRRQHREPARHARASECDDPEPG